MTFYEFQLLDEREQMNLLYLNGAYIGKKKDKEQVIVLYQLEGFYVEIYYKKYRYYISNIKSYTSVDCLDSYLVDINVDELIKCMN